MNKTVITIPKGIRYLSQWNEFHLGKFPEKCIINKTIPGCGFTRFCIETPFENVILCSPRKMLLQNKYEQHSNLCYLVRNELDQDPQIDMDIVKEKKVIEEDNPDNIHITNVKSRLYQELQDYFFSHPLQKKILVTYDSFKILKEVLEELGVFKNFFVIIDEMQALGQDARFKASTEINFLYHLQNSHSAIFVSATPMLEEYLDELPEFKDLPYYVLDWKTEDFTRVVKPNLDIHRMTSIVTESKKIIDKFKQGNYDSINVIENGIPVTKYAMELVFYVNSVSMISKIIKSNNLLDSEVNILCSNTEENQRRIWKNLLQKGQINLAIKPYTIGRVPLEGEPRKPITLCTRTVYLGADFYSDCAKSYIFSDANSDYLSVDISMDLPQILGRQRCNENPWKNSATFFYKTTSDGNQLTKEDFDQRLTKKKESSESLMNVWMSSDEKQRVELSRIYLNSIKYAHYKDDYISVNRLEIVDPITGKKEIKLIPIINNLIFISEKRAFDIQQIDYADRFSVFTTITYNNQQNLSTDIEFQVVEFFRVYDKLTKISDKLRLLCETCLSNESRVIILNQIPDTDKVKYFYIAAGPDRCRALYYSPKKISNELGIKFFSKSEIANSVYQEFSGINILPLSEIKEKIKIAYSKIEYDRSPKAIDLKEFFEVSECTVVDKVSKKRIKCYKLLKKLL